MQTLDLLFVMWATYITACLIISILKDLLPIKVQSPGKQAVAYIAGIIA